MSVLRAFQTQILRFTPNWTLPCCQLSSVTTDKPLKDRFLQQIESSPLLKELPDFEVVGQGKGTALPAEAQDRFAVIQFGAHQFKVTPEDKIYIEKVRHLDVNSEIHLKRVLVWASRDETIVGRPYIKGAFVHALVEVHKIQQLI